MTSQAECAARRRRLFEIGSLTISSEVERHISAGRLNPMPFLQRHSQGDWGDLLDVQWDENNRAFETGGPVESFYLVHTGLAIYILTEADRSATYIRLSSERW